MPRDTRAEILAVATELFTDQGYEKTSLREIAERLDITKAALYYHFPSKEDMLLALIEPMFETAFELMDRLGAARNVEEWAAALDWTLGAIVDHVSFFRLIQRNRQPVELIGQRLDEMRDHIALHEQLAKAAHAAASDLRQEIRMVAALAALTGFDDWAPTLLAETPPEILRVELSDTIHDILGLPRL
ncbi:MAG: TetR/AcrR family transcriptional regulator, partial [Candidatus Limnocylindrales bacterium]